MKQEQEHIKTYSARDIQQYLEGKLSPAEMHAIEKAALDDPFLADAMEGYAVGDTNQQNKDLQSLRINLEARINKEKKKSLLIPIWMRAAIIVLAISVGGLAIYNLYNANTEVHNEPIAKNAKVGPAPVDTITANEQPKIDSQAIVQIDTRLYRKEEDKVVAKKSAPAATRQVIPSAIPEPAAAEKQAVASAHVKDEVEQQAAKSAIRDRETEAKEVDARSLQNDQAMNAFSGKVLDSKNKPVAGATILARNRKASTVTDINGQFNISAPDSVLNIEVNSLGYQQNNATLKNNKNVSNNIVLQEANASLDEVVVVGYGAKGKKEAYIQKRDSARLKAMEDVEPLGGWDEYDSYISSNIRKPSGMDDVDGEVILSFEVNEKNEISNIRIIKSLSQDLDKEAIRLVKEGPQWKSKKGRKAKGKLAIKF